MKLKSEMTIKKFQHLKIKIEALEVSSLKEIKNRADLKFHIKSQYSDRTSWDAGAHCILAFINKNINTYL